MTHTLVYHYQDNKNTILLETNGKLLSIKQTKKVKMWFFIKDKIEHGDIKAEHKTTEKYGFM